jgi:SAM-dependent methyltransferase
MTVQRRTDPRVVWHDTECGAYTADLPVWHELADAAGGPVLDIGAGTGRVALSLAAAGHEVVALDRDPALLRALEERGAGLPVSVACVDAREFDLGREFALCLIPMQTIQLMAGPAERARVLSCARGHLRPDAMLAAAITADLEPFEAGPSPPLPDIREDAGTVYSSRPVALREEGESIVIERVRESVAPDGERTEELDTVVLSRVEPQTLAREMQAAGLAPHPARLIPATREHVGSWVVTGRA